MAPNTLKVPDFIGTIHVSWSNYEITLEVISKRLLNLSDRKGHIVFGSLGVQAKTGIAISLLLESGDSDASDIIKSIKTIGQLASRNHIFHSLMFVNRDWSQVTFVKREAANGLSAKEKKLENEELAAYVHRLADEVVKLQKLASVSNADIQVYADAVKA